MIKNNFNFLGVMIFSSLIVGSYQLPLIENTLNKYGYENNLNEIFHFSKDLQQTIEDQKISFSSLLSEENTKKHSSELMINKQVPVPVTLPVNIEQSNINGNNTSINNTSHIDTVNSSSINPTSQLPVTANHCTDSCTILMIGDSVMGDIDFSLQRLIKKDFPKWRVIDGHKVSSGLTNQTYYDWPLTAKKLVEKYKPDYVFVLLGTNDAQGMTFNGKALPFSKEQWINQYSNRVNQIKDIIENNQANWYWIALPVAKDNSFNSRLQVIRNIQQENTKEHYISVESIFGQNNHCETINMKLRAADGIHLNSSGADLLAKQLVNKLR